MAGSRRFRSGIAAANPGSPAIVFLLLALVTAVGGCANTLNYTDPAGPRFAGGGAEARAPISLKVVTFNIEYARRVDSALALFHSDSGLKNADVIALQEMDEGGVQRIAEALGLNYVYYPAVLHPVPKQDFGNALLSRWPIAGDRKIILPHLSLSRHAQRIAVTGTVLVGGREIQVYAVHIAGALEVGFGGQKDQLRTVLDDADSVGRPAIIAGDMNSREVGAEAAARGYAWPTRDLGSTHHGFDLDHVFVRGLDPPSQRDAGVVHDVRGASDHHPVWVTLELAGLSREASRGGGTGP
jgi:endonuclease/exonuclease/phosphatase family metal-dependent hydrolase